MTPFIYAGLYFLALLGIGALVNMLMVPVFGKWWRLVVAPGVILHELAHALGCVLTGAHVYEINFWKPSGGHVMHSPPKFHILGPVIISFAPTIVMTLGMLVLLPMLHISPGTIAWINDVPQSFGAAVGGYPGALLALLRSFSWTTLTPWLFAYGMLNVAVTITPSSRDLENTKWAFVALVIGSSALLAFFGVQIPVATLWPPAATSVLFLGVALVAAGLIRGVWQILPGPRE